MNKLRFIKVWGFFGLVQIGLLFYLCLKTPTGSTFHIQNIDKVFHFSAYFLMSFYFCSMVRIGRFTTIVIPLSLLGTLIELLQEQTGYRSFEYFDMIANGTGAIIGFMSVKYVYDKLLFSIENIFNDDQSSRH